MKQNWRTICSEFAAGLAVIACFALIFVYQPVGAAFAHPAPVLGTADFSYCGDWPDKETGPHGPCHACRLKAAVLPQPPEEALPAFLPVIAKIFSLEASGAQVLPNLSPYHPRGPPRAVL
ncbi:hypothetical protein [Martelella radicis]|uniref:DUF2946 domain-containing protein n=1 Tax=Martelella radicis TaxID=1397476 RepID=A0A7W6PA46_9HYPH|nr:hypothetical protein [Martelella radicis]MBB4122977.1 hypothetical protein [Martelella radicis]